MVSHDLRSRGRFPTASRLACCLDGLATLADVWLNGRRLLVADNMFRAYRVDVSRLSAAGTMIWSLASVRSPPN